MVRQTGASAVDLQERFAAFVTERYPFAAALALDAFAAAYQDSTAVPIAASKQVPAADIQMTSLQQRLAFELRERLRGSSPTLSVETTPGVTAPARFDNAVEELVSACHAFLTRESLRASLSDDERREILRGMFLTRATDNRLKLLFTGGEVRYGDASFQGKGFRSLGQEAIYAAGIRLRRGDAYRAGSRWCGDVVAPVIRDLGVVLAMRPTADTVRMVLSAQMAKAGPPMDGKDLHTGDLSWGILPAAAPLAIGSLDDSRNGDGLLARGRGPGRALVHRRGWFVARGVARGDQPLRGATAASRLLRAEQPDRALDADRASSRRCGCSPTRPLATESRGSRSTGRIPTRLPQPLPGRSIVRVPARARRSSSSCACACAVTRTTTTCSISARIRRRVGAIPTPSSSGYADLEQYAFWSSRDPLERYAARLIAEELVGPGDVEDWKREASALVDEQARQVIDAPWPDAERAGSGVFLGELPRQRTELLDSTGAAATPISMPDRSNRALPFDRQGQHVSRRDHARRSRRAARWIRAPSCSVRTSAASTETLFCCSVRCSRSSAIAS